MEQTNFSMNERVCMHKFSLRSISNTHVKCKNTYAGRGLSRRERFRTSRAQNCFSPQIRLLARPYVYLWDRYLCHNTGSSNYESFFRDKMMCI